MEEKGGRGGEEKVTKINGGGGYKKMEVREKEEDKMRRSGRRGEKDKGWRRKRGRGGRGDDETGKKK